jgi:UDP-2,3-diacylglucosamine pyrophosphatase LpxH
MINRDLMYMRTAILGSLIALLLFLNSNALAQRNLACSPTEPSANRLTVIISDLHMGVGKKSGTDEWNEMEDFRWVKEFNLFLEEINKQGKGKTDFIINGDLFELWQFLKDNCDYGDPNLGCTERDALKRVQDVIEAHRPEMEMLRKFVDSPGENRLYIVPGNHDAALLYSSVNEELLNRIHAAPGKVCIMSSGHWLSTDGLIYVDHGHQIEEGDPNTFYKWPSPFIEEKGQTYLIRTWGEGFVQKYYNDIENKFPIIDNLSDEKIGFKYAVAARGFLLPADIAKLLKFILFQVSEDQFISSLYAIYLRPDETRIVGDWGIKTIRENNDDRFVLDLLPLMEKLPLENGINRTAIKRAAEDGKLSCKPSDLSDDEILSLCDLRSVLIETMEKKNEKISIQKCPSSEEKKLFIKKYVKGADTVFKSELQAYINKRYEELSSGNKKYPKFMIFIYGHTHKAHDDTIFNIALPGNWFPKVLNSGAWIRTINPDQLKILMREMNLEDKAVLPEAQPEQLPSCYSFVMIEPYREGPVAKLKSWSIGSNGMWEVSAPCKTAR